MRRFILMSLPLMIAACDPAGLTDTPTGTYVEEKDVTETGDPDFLTKGCDTNGNPILGIDPDIKVGAKIEQITKIETKGAGQGDIDMTTEVVSLASNAIAQKYKVNAVNNYSGYTAGQTFNVQCSMATGSMNCTTDGPTTVGTEHTKYEDCQFTAQPEITGKLTKGRYTFKNGPVVTAFKLTLTGKAAIQCGTETFAEAVVEQNLLTSNDIPSTEFNYCGGSVISFYTKITGDKKILKATFSERTNAGITTLVTSSTGKGALVVPFERYFDTDFIQVKPQHLNFPL